MDTTLLWRMTEDNTPTLVVVCGQLSPADAVIDIHGVSAHVDCAAYRRRQRIRH